MKYRQRLVSSSAPASLQEWLAEELERRGIDGVYTRYILSLLLADTIDPTECAHLSPYPKANTQQLQHVCENRLADKSRHRRLKSWEHEKQEQGLLGHVQCQKQEQSSGNCCHCCQPYLDNEQRKKLAAVECLKSASEQKCGIEKLIDEVCAKLKNLQADIETNPDSELHARIKGTSKQSSPQGQAELYYAAFPALIGRPEPFGDLHNHAQLLLQEPCNLRSTAWGIENCNWKVKPLDIHEVAQNEGEECDESDIEKEDVIVIEDDCCCYTKRRLSTDPGFLDNVETNLQPQFIVPKIEVPPTKVANITMYTPFMSAATYQHPGINDKVEGEDECWEEGEKENREGTLLPVLGEEQCCKWGILSSYDRTEENELVTDLASKFNSELAAIWETSSIPEHSLDTDNLGFSFSILSVQTPVPEKQCAPHPTSINFFIGSNFPSVWSTNKDDVKMLNTQETVDQLELSSSTISIPSLLHNLANHILVDKVERIRGDSLSLLWTSEEGSDFFPDDGSSPKSFRLDLSEQGWEDVSLVCDSNVDERNTLFVCPDNLFLDSEENEHPASLNSSSVCLSPLESTAEIVTGIYSLWNSPSPQPPFPLKGNILRLPLTAAPYNDKVVNWISHQRDIRYSNWPDASCRENCTLTYHKGESRFKEVVPLAKLKMEPFEELDIQCKKSCSHDDPYESQQDEPEENLLTSPKTHFQPIRQDSSESESASDSLEVLETPVLLLLPHENSPQLVVTTPVPDEESLRDSESDNRLGRSVSSSMDEMLLLTGQFEPGEESELGDSPDTLDMLQALQSEIKPELLRLRDKSTSTDALFAAVENTRSKQMDMLGFRNFRKDQIWSTDSMDDPSTELTLPWKWSTTDDSEELWKMNDYEEENEDAFDASFLKKTVLDCTLEAMRKELEEEEEELFRDINLLSDPEDYEAAFSEGFTLFSVEEGLACSQIAETVCISESPVNVVETWKEELVITDDAGNFLEDLQSERRGELKLPAIPIDKVLYSSELENEWHNASQTFNVQVPKKGKPKNKIQGQQQHHSQQMRKPCSFFLEGNCRRSDCKFSHNLGSITCRFWEEGSCFKGVTCPFLHGYASDPGLCQQGVGKCKFALESEADFPSLSALSSSTESSIKPFPKEIVVGRIIRPKKKKVGAVVVSGNKKSNSPPPK